jgi:A/G-specific adenine glycosylase
MATSQVMGEQTRTGTPRPTRSITDSILSWYGLNGRTFPWRSLDLSEYECCVYEVLLQQTPAPRVATVGPAVLRCYPDWSSLASASATQLEASLKPLGLQRRRTATLVRLAQTVLSLGGKLPEAREELMTLPGVSHYVASAIEVQMRGRKDVLLDVNAARVLTRVRGNRRLIDFRYDTEFRDYALGLVPSNRAREFNWGLLDLGAAVCRPTKPRCTNCPLAGQCDYAKRTAV